MTQAPATPELVERLKNLATGFGVAPIYQQAASALEAQQARIAELEKVLRKVAANAKTMKNAKALVGPAETHRDPRIRRMWEKWSYGEGQTLWKIVRQALSSQGRREGGEG